MTESNQNPKQKQKRNKIIIIVVLGFVALCLIVCGAAYFSMRRAVTDIAKVDPEQAKNLAIQITDYDLPSGYKEFAGSTMLGVVTAIITDKNELNTIFLVQAPSDNLPAPEKILRDTIAYQRNNPIVWTAEDVRIYTVRSEKISIKIYTGVTQDDLKYHAWAGKFKGKGGPALIVIVGPDETWDENMAEAFINSMR
jgi:hypothetical protein